MQILYSLWNGGLMDLSKTYKVEFVKKINAILLRSITSRCDENDQYYWRELFEAIEMLLVRMIEKNSEGRRHLLFVVDKEILGIVNKINNIQNCEEKHYKYLEWRKHRKPQYNLEKRNRKKHKHHTHDSSSSESESDCD